MLQHTTYRYHKVTTNCVIPPTPTGSPYRRAKPKSATLIVPRLFMSRLLVLRSRWSIQLEWQWFTADKSCNMRVLTSDCKNGEGIFVSNVLRSCSMKSITTKTLGTDGAGLNAYRVHGREKSKCILRQNHG